MKNNSGKNKTVVQTTGHAWDGDIQEFNNPIPRWWLWSFYATVIFAMLYWLLYPSWPLADGYLKGIFNEIEYQTQDGKQYSSHWNTRALLMKDIQQARQAQQKYIDLINSASFDEILNDQILTDFSHSKAKVLFADNCAPCHQAGGAGVVGAYPNLADDSWLWGGSYTDLQNTISNGRIGFMPGFRETLNENKLNQLAEYVLSLSGENGENDLIAKGKKIFNGQEGGCFYCHLKTAIGLKSTGAANLTDKVWTIANIAAAETHQQKLTAIKAVISTGVHRSMPAWKSRLSSAEIKILSIYVHKLGGGQ